MLRRTCGGAKAPSSRENPSRDLFRSSKRTSLPTDSYLEGWEEGGDDAKSAWPSDTLGYTRVTMRGTTGRNAVRRSKPL